MYGLWFLPWCVMLVWASFNAKCIPYITGDSPCLCVVQRCFLSAAQDSSCLLVLASGPAWWSRQPISLLVNMKAFPGGYFKVWPCTITINKWIVYAPAHYLLLFLRHTQFSETVCHFWWILFLWSVSQTKYYVQPLPFVVLSVYVGFN